MLAMPWLRFSLAWESGNKAWAATVRRRAANNLMSDLKIYVNLST